VRVCTSLDVSALGCMGQPDLWHEYNVYSCTPVPVRSATAHSLSVAPLSAISQVHQTGEPPERNVAAQSWQAASPYDGGLLELGHSLEEHVAYEGASPLARPLHQGRHGALLFMSDDALASGSA
jgi:hypothetical protein